MAPSIAQIPDATEATTTTLPLKGGQATESKPKVRRIIDEEGGKTTASVSILCPINEELETS
jgi:hypothetical protein